MGRVGLADVPGWMLAGGGWTGRTKPGPVMWRPVSISAIAVAATTPTTIAPPIETPVANAWRSRRYSVLRRSRSQAGSAARREAQLLNGAAAMPSVGTSKGRLAAGRLAYLSW